MGPIWEAHKGLMRDLQHGSMLDPHGQSHMGTIWELYGSSMGKINPHFFQKKTFLHIFIQMIISPQSQPIFGLVRSQQRESYVHVQVIVHAKTQEALKIVGVLFNSWKWWPHAYLYIPQF